MADQSDVPDWVQRWEQAKAVVGISAAFLVLCAMAALLVALPFLAVGVMEVVYQSLGRPSPVGYWELVAYTALLEVGVLGYVVLETLAYRHRHGGAE